MSTYVKLDSDAASWLVGGGEMGALMRAMDWENTPLGPPETWSPSLKMMARFLLANRFPILLWWGPEFCQLYNDAYRPILGTKHPQFLGRPTYECWSEVWHILRPLIETPFYGGPATWIEDFELELNRYSYLEESHFTIAYSPVPDETVPSGIGGVIATVHEITEKVVGERRIVVLRDLSTRAIEAKTAEDACLAAAATLAKHPKDVPFALLYLIDHEAKHLRLAGAAGVERGTEISPEVISLEPGNQPVWPVASAVEAETTNVVEDLHRRFGSEVPKGPWSDAPTQAVITPIRSNVSHQPAGVLVFGVSARLQLDESYRSFIDLAATQIATAVANARAYEEERKRAEALAEIDRAKIAFFSNVSHEFRTPLTLMLGPLQDLLADQELPETVNEQLSLAHRNSQRLLKLVNTLLDFSRIEAGRIEATYEPTELSQTTAEIASVFRTTVERAGLEFVVDCAPLNDLVYVDREMWEKILLNLISNAFKFTFEGGIKIELKQSDEMVHLSVSDTGTGIPPAELPHLFERFHRVKGARGRSYEGSGIGLALVQELVKLHGGNVTVETEVDRGSTFTVSIPMGKAHLPADRINAQRHLSSTGLRGASYVEEALRWTGPNGNKLDHSVLPEANGSGHLTSGQTPPATRRKLVLADDNADMRDYLKRLLSSDYEVTEVSNGREALRAVRERRPDLLLADVMMPELDGFGLLSKLRSDDQLKAVPVILLSARAGDDSRVEGLEAGADDYLVKPFSARELLARVGGTIALARMRREVEVEKEKSFAILEYIADSFYAIDSEFRVAYMNRRAEEYFKCNREDCIGRNVWEVFPEGKGTVFQENYEHAVREHVPVAFESLSAFSNRWVDVRAYPAAGWLLVNFRDVTERKLAQRERELADAKNKLLVQLDDAIRPLDDPNQITLTAAKILGEHLHVDRCAYADIEADEDSMYLAGNYLSGPDVRSIVGNLKFQDFGAEVLRLMRENKPYVVNDIDTHEPPVTDFAAYRATQVQAVICVPLHKAGKFVAAMAVHSKTPRVWAAHEVELVQLVAARCWESIERARVTRALQQSETLYRAFVTASSDVVYRMSPDWTEMRQLEGREFIADTKQPARDWLTQYIHPDDQRKVLSAINEAIRNRADFELEHRVFRVDGTFGWTSSRAIPILDEEGEIVEWLGTASDFTRRKKAEEALRNSEEKYRTVLSSMDEGLMIAEVIFDETGYRAIDYIVLETNEAFYKHTGLPHGIVGKTIREIVAGGEVPWLGIYGAVALSGEPIRFEYEITIEPLVGWYDIFIQRIGEPDQHRVAVMFQDITERKKVEESIAKQNERLSLLWEAAGVLLSTNEPDAMLSSLFEKIRRTLNLDVYFNFMVTESGDSLRLVSYAGIDEQTAQSISRLEFGQAVCGRVTLSRQSIVATGIQDSCEPMVQLVKGFGVRAYACNPLLAGGRLLGTLSFASRTRDRYDQDEIEFLETISKYVTAAYERLHLIEQLQDQDRRKDEFLATLAHELRNPLAPMHNGLQLIRLAGNNPSTLDKARAMMERQLQQMKRLVDDLLDVSRISRNKLELRKEFVELSAIVRSATETSRPLIEAANQKLEVSLPPEPILLDGDPVRLAQAFSNLLNNASKYSEPGSRIWLQAEHRDDEVVVRVRDTGIGIPADKLPRIFDIFMQVDLSLERSQGGLGIGLTLVRQLVQMHGGSVEVRSNGPGKGSEFVVRLPLLVAPTSAAELEPAPALTTSTQARRILVADDNEDSAESLSTMLELLGHKVEMAHDGADAVEVAKTFLPELVFLDLGMPRMNGYDAARLIRSLPGCNGVVLVALTGWGQEEDKRRSQEAGFDFHIVKPIDFTVVEKLLV